MKASTTAFVLILFSVLSIAPIFAQNTISSKSQPTKLDLKPEYKRGLPPILYAVLSFEDDNNNGILEANEKAKITLDIRNQGKGPAQDLRITVKDYDMDPAYLYMNTIQYQEPRLSVAGLEIVDMGEGTAAINQDGKLQTGEMVKVKITVQNLGQNVSEHTTYNVVSKAQNIFIPDGAGSLGDLGIGEVKGLWVTISPNKRVNTSGNLPIFLTLKNEYHRGEVVDQLLPIALDQKPPEPVILSVKADMDKLQKQVARFEVNTDRLTASFSKETINLIRMVNHHLISHIISFLSINSINIS